MKRLLAAVVSFALINVTVPALSVAAECPPELAQAKAALQKAQQALRKSQTAKARAEAVAKDRPDEGVPVPRGPKDRPDEGVPVPRGPKDRPDEGVPVPRGEDIQAPRVAKARALVRQADHACKQGDLALSAQKAKEALALLK
jgi:hypothetical protein